MLTPVMNAEERLAYVTDRKLISGKEGEKQLEQLNRIIIHNGYTTNAVKNDRKFPPSTQAYKPKKSTEWHFFNPKTGDLDIVNTRGIIRFDRDVEQARFLDELIEKDQGRKITIDERHIGGSMATADAQFGNLAFAKATEIFDYLGKNKGRIEDQGKLFLISGPHKSGTNNASLLDETKDDYLNHRILDIGNNVVVHVDYLFGDQGELLLNNFYRCAHSEFGRMPVHFFHYGKMGLLQKEASVGDLLLPVSAFDGRLSLFESEGKVPLSNALTNEKVYKLFSKDLPMKPRKGTTVHMNSVMEQTKNELKRVHFLGGDFLDMEILRMRGVSYGKQQPVQLYFAGVGSDKPLSGETLADTTYPQENEQAIFDGYVNIIQNI